jgi:HTH-type transcriptional regulator, competence development regulator
MSDFHKLGDYLREGRAKSGLTLRDVQDKVRISNAYLSQLEGYKVAQPSPVVLHKLCELYGISYALAMEYAGYPVPTEARFSSDEQKFASRLGRTSHTEQAALLDYLQFLRAKNR